MTITKTTRVHKLNQKPVIIWFTGLSGAGKTATAEALELKLCNLGLHTFLLDGDLVREGLCKDLGFSIEDRKENVRRVGEVAKLMLESGLIVLASFISPLRDDRDAIRTSVENDEFIEVYMKTPLEVCEERDCKGLYQKAREGLIPDFTGIDSVYEAPVNAELEIDSSDQNLDDICETILSFLQSVAVVSKNI